LSRGGGRRATGGGGGGGGRMNEVHRDTKKLAVRMGRRGGATGNDFPPPTAASIATSWLAFSARVPATVAFVKVDY